MTTFLKTVLSLLNQKGVSKNKMLTDLHLGKNSFVNWENRGTIPGGDTLNKIAEYFNVSTDYLLGNETKEEPLDKTDQEILVLARKTRDLPEEDKKRFLEVLRGSVNAFIREDNK